MRHVCCLLESFRGMAKGTQPRTQPALYDVLSALLPHLLRIQTAYRAYPHVTCLLLKLAGDIVDGHVSFLSAPAAQGLCHWVLELLRLYAKYNMGLVSVQVRRTWITCHGTMFEWCRCHGRVPGMFLANALGH